MPLREVAPLIAEETLRKLKDWFPEPSFVFRLDPSYEPTEAQFNPEHGDIFKQLQCAIATA